MKEFTKIKNIKTVKTAKQINDEISLLKSKKRLELTNTDWTQLPDVPLYNREDFSAWRNKLRTLEIVSNSDEKRLEELISEKPVPIFNEHRESTKVESDNYVVYEQRGCAVDAIRAFLIEEKHLRLDESDQASYPLFRLLQEELVEHEIGNTPPRFLERYMKTVGLNPNATEDLKEVETTCREYFSKINEIFLEFEQKIRRVYTMSDEELDEELAKRGYRYRPSN